MKNEYFQNDVIDLRILGDIGSVCIYRFPSAVEEEMTINGEYCFTDSQVSLAWVKAENRELTTFVQNRVKEIRKDVDPRFWRYCRTDCNPADLITRVHANGIWWYGPEFLRGDFDSEINDSENKIKQLKVFLNLHPN